MGNRRVVSSLGGCENPLCPRANWSNTELPRWWLRLSDGRVAEIVACDADCAREAGRYVQARHGSRPNEPISGGVLTRV